MFANVANINGFLGKQLPMSQRSALNAKALTGMCRDAKGNKMKTNCANLGFEQKLWQAADKLRSNMDAAEYKHVVLGLIFLKYISDVFSEVYEELKKDPEADPEYVGEYKEEQIVKDGEIVVAQTDLTQKAEVIGTPAIVNSLGQYEKLIASLDLQIVRPKK